MMLSPLLLFSYLLLGTLMSELSPHEHSFRIETPACADMPIWVRIECVAATSPAPHESNRKPEVLYPEFPFQVHRDDPAEYDFELRHNGQAVPPLQNALRLWWPFGNMAPAGTAIARLPLHLRFRINEPGDYEVRLVTVGGIPGVQRAPSNWIAFHVDAPTDAQRSEFDGRLRTAAPASPAELVRDYLPALAVHPNVAALTLLKPYLVHDDPYARIYAWYVLNFFPDDDVRDTALEILGSAGPLYPISWHFAARKELYAARVDDIARTAVAQFAKSPETRTCDAIDFFQTLRHQYQVSPGLQERMNDAVRAAVPRLKQRGPLSSDVVKYIASNGMTDCRPLVWEAVENPQSREQALICLTWMPEPRDLPRMTECILQGPGNLRSLPYHMNRAYGDAAVPFLIELLSKSTDIHVLRESALSLALRNRREGYVYLRSELQHQPGVNSEAFWETVTNILTKDNAARQGRDYSSQSLHDELIRILDEKIAALPATPK